MPDAYLPALACDSACLVWQIADGDRAYRAGRRVVTRLCRRDSPKARRMGEAHSLAGQQIWNNLNDRALYVNGDVFSWDGKPIMVYSNAPASLGRIFVISFGPFGLNK